jgi:hypothetical protein
MQYLNEKSITVISFSSRPTFRYYVTSRVLENEPKMMDQSMARLISSSHFIDIQAVAHSTLEVTAQKESSWILGDPTVLANLIVGLGWAADEVTIFDRDSSAPQRVFREVGRVTEASTGPIYHVVSHA